MTTLIAPDLWPRQQHKMRLATVWGSGTAVGKTLVSAGLMRAAAARSLPSLFLKPVQTGVPDSDGAFVARAAGCQHVVGEHAAAAGLSTSGPSPSAASATPPPQRALTLFAWRPAVSPHVAVEREGRGVSDAELRRATVAEIDRFAAALAASPMADGLPDAPRPSRDGRSREMTRDDRDCPRHRRSR